MKKQKQHTQQIAKKTLEQVKADIAKLTPEDIKIERTPPCDHMVMKKLVKGSFAYQCQECNGIFLIVGSAMYRPDQYINESMLINKHLMGQNPELLKAYQATVESDE